MQVSKTSNVVFITGLALFAMFFGAGNIIFPLKIGSEAGQHVMPALVAFVISGVGVPFLGLFAVALYEGDYWKFFQRFGKIPAFLMVTFLILIIGPLFCAPRTEIVTYNTLLPVLPTVIKNSYVFNALYCGVLFLLVAKQSRLVDVIGGILSPVKIIAFTILIVFALYAASPLQPVSDTAAQLFHSSLTTGYGTMDLLGAFFFCTVAYKNIVNKCQSAGITAKEAIIKMTLYSCVIGAFFIAAIYAGLIYAAATHAQSLQNVPTEAMIGKLSYVVLGQYGSVFVGVCVTFACLATAAGLVEVTTDFLHNIILRQKLPRVVCVLMVLAVTYMMAILGFDTIMKIAGPILNVLYPVLIVLCVINIAFKLKKSDRTQDAKEAIANA